MLILEQRKPLEIKLGKKLDFWDNLDVSRETFHKLEVYKERLLLWNKKINLISKSKSKDMNIVQEPYSSFTASNRTSVLYYNNEERINNIELTSNFIDSLSTKYETEKEIKVNGLNYILS